MTRQEISTLYDDNAWANARALGAAEALTPEQPLRDLGNSFPSVRDTLAHILGAEWIWRRRWLGESPSGLLPLTEFPAVASLRDRFAAVEEERLLLVRALQHVVSHGTYHRGQVTTMLRQLGANPVSTDLSRFHLERGASTP